MASRHRKKGSKISKASSSIAHTIRVRSRPLYREARTHVRAARGWTNSFRKRMNNGPKNEMPLLTPARPRRRRPPSLILHEEGRRDLGRSHSRPSSSCFSPTDAETVSGAATVAAAVGSGAIAAVVTGARNSPGVKRVLHRATSAASEVRWEAASGLDALLECGASAGSAAGRACTALGAMADAKFQQLRRSISNWSLSTVKKPKISISKLKTPSLNLFTRRKRNRVEPNDGAEATEEVKSRLLRGEAPGPEGQSEERINRLRGSQIIHEPNKANGEFQPTIVLTVDDQNDNFDPPSPQLSNPGLLGPNDDIDYIDSDGDEDDGVMCKPSGHMDYNDQWFDCRGTLTRSKEEEDLRSIGHEYDDCHISTYYEAPCATSPSYEENNTVSNSYDLVSSMHATGPNNAKQIQETSSESKSPSILQTNEKEVKRKLNYEDFDKNVKGSHKARAWVQSLNEETEERVKKWIEMQKMKKSGDNIPKSNSEIRLDLLEDTSSRWAATRDEINLNAANDDESYEEYLRRYHNEVESPSDLDKDDAARKESLKRIFQVRGKLALKNVVDSQQPSYTNTDIYLASTPFALANSSGQKPHDISQEGISCGSLDLESYEENESKMPDIKTTENNRINNLLPESTLVVSKNMALPDVISNAPEVIGNKLKSSENKKELDINTPVRHDDIDKCNNRKLTSKEEISPTNTAKTIHYEVNETTDIEEQQPEITDNSAEEHDKITSESKEIESDTITYELEDNESTSVTETADETVTSLISDTSTPNDMKKPDRKKKKISTPNIQKSIKNFAGSIFSHHDTNSKKEQTETKDTEKKRRSKFSPFTKDYLIKGSSDKKVTPIIDRGPADVPETNSISDTPTPDSLRMDGKQTGRSSSESLEYASPIESDEQRSPASHESSPGVGNPFVEEDGLVIRKEAIIAAKAMENDDNASNYYSFLTAMADDEEHSGEPHESKPLVKKELDKPDVLIENDSEKTKLPVKMELGKTELSCKQELEKPELPPKKGMVLPLNDISVFHEPPRKELINSKSTSNEAPTNSINETSKSDSQGTWHNNQKSKTESAKTSPAILPSTCTQSPSQAQATTPVKEQVPPEIPKLKFSSNVPDMQVPPKPSPRTKKGRYGYSTGSLTPTTPSTPIDTTSTKVIMPQPQNPSNSVNNNKKENEYPTKDYDNSSISGYTKTDSIKESDSSSMSGYPKTYTESTLSNMTEADRAFANTSYNGPPNNYYETEPIYWEISETTGAPSRPSPRPRGKKGQRTPSEQSLNVSTPSTPTKSSMQESISTTIYPDSPSPPSEKYTNVPGWINKRAPIPSPRGKKQRSLQSLPNVVPTEETMETAKKKLQSMSSAQLSTPHQVHSPPIPKKNAREEEAFYSGKAASISYGFTPNHSKAESITRNLNQEPSVPSPPIRSKKASQMSLPSAVMAEESLSKQQKRISVHEFSLPRSHGKGAAPRPPSTRRSRRRTDPTHGMTAAALRSAIRRFDANLMTLTDLLTAVGIAATPAMKSEEHLCSVLYSVQSLMGVTGGGSWTVNNTGDSRANANNVTTNVNLSEVTKELQAAYQVNNEVLHRLLQEANNRPTPEVNLHLKIKEAKNLRPKTVKGKTNSYATVTIPGTGDSHRTRLQKNTLDPVWNQEFTLKVLNLQKDTVKLEVWHEHDSVGVQQITAVRDIKGFSRLLKGTTEQAKHLSGHLLGKVALQIKTMSEGGADGWYALEKDGEQSKERGNIHVEGKVISTAQIDHPGRQSYDALLTRLVHHKLTLASKSKQEGEWTPPWSGQLSAAATAALAQHAIMLSLTDAQVHMSWWLVASRIDSINAAWLLSQLHRVQASLAKGLYQPEELIELKSSFSFFVHAITNQLKDLHKSYPTNSGVLAQNQLMYTLKALHSLQTHQPSRELLDQENVVHIHELVTSSVSTHSKNWWMLLVEEQLRGVKTADEQILRVIKIVDEAYTFLNQAAVFYNGAFMKEMNIPYLQSTYLMVSKKINPCVRPLLMNIYNRMPPLHDDINGGDSNVQYALEVGTSLWQLYRNLGRLHTLGESLPVEARAESGVREYHRWFSKGVMRWLEIAICRAQEMIRKAVELDNFQPVDESCDFSSSALDTTGIFHDVKNWWLKLAWPDPEHSAVLLTKILEDVCSCGTSYSDLLREKVDYMFRSQTNRDQTFITQQICVGLNNIERVRRELTGLPKHFGFDATLEQIRDIDTGSTAALQLQNTVKTLIVSSSENMETKVTEFIEAVILRVRPTLDRALNESCETQSEIPLLNHTLDPGVQRLITQLNESNFKRFLWALWETLIGLFEETINRNAERRKATYFGAVHNILEMSLTFFAPDSGIGLDLDEAMTKEYNALLDLLDMLRVSTDALIAKYYHERYEEQLESNIQSKAQVVVKVLFTRPGKLIVEVIMARDIVTESDAISISSRSGLHALHALQPVDSYVKVQLVPQEWFPTATIRKTKTQRKADPAVYEETFEYDLSRSDDGVQAGHLLLTLKDYNLGRSNTFIGEAIVPLGNLPCVDSSQVHTVPNTYIKMTTPGLDMGYKSLRALHLRTSDKMASSFLKKVSKRLPDSKIKSPAKSDDDRHILRSPNLMDRFKFT